jgi:hypothetical protein
MMAPVFRRCSAYRVDGTHQEIAAGRVDEPVQLPEGLLGVSEHGAGTREATASAPSEIQIIIEEGGHYA